MHLLIGETLERVRMNKVAVMKTDALLHLEENRGAEELSPLSCVDMSGGSLADAQNTDLLQSQEATENSSTIKYRRYGYAPFSHDGNMW